MSLELIKNRFLKRWERIHKAIDKTILFNSFWLFLGEGTSKGAMFLATILLIRYLSPTEYGYFSLANSLAVTTGMVIDFGLSTIVTRDLSGNLENTQKYLSNILTLKLLLGIFYLLLIGIIELSPLFNGHDQWTWLLYLLALFIWLQDLTGLFASVFIAEEKMEKLFFVQVIHYCGIAFAALLSFHFHWDLRALVLAYVTAAFIGASTAYFFICKARIRLTLRLDRLFLSRILRSSLPLLGALMLTTVYSNADTLIIGHMLGAEAVGYYQGAYKFLFVFQSVNLFNTALFPRVSIYTKSDSHKALNQLHIGVSLLFLFLILPGTILSIMLIKPLLLFIYGEKMLPSIEPLRYMIGAASVYFVRGYLANLLIAQERQRLMFVAFFAGLFLNIVINLDLIPQYGIAAGGITLLLSEIVMCSIMMLCLKSKRSPVDDALTDTVHPEAG